VKIMSFRGKVAIVTSGARDIGMEDILYSNYLIVGKIEGL